MKIQKNKLLLINRKTKELVLISSDYCVVGTSLDEDIFLKNTDESQGLVWIHDGVLYDTVIGQIGLDECHGHEKIGMLCPGSLVYDDALNTVELSDDYESPFVRDYIKVPVDTNTVNVCVGPNGTFPTQAYPGDSGYDLYTSEDITIQPGKCLYVKTEVSLKLPKGYEAQIRPKSSYATTDLDVIFGTIDNTYTGEIKIACRSMGELIKLSKGTPIAQLVIMELPKVALTKVSDIKPSTDPNSRGNKGFGSSLSYQNIDKII